MTGPPCGELSRYLDELRAQRKAEAVETEVIPDNCMALGPPGGVVLMPEEKPQWRRCGFCNYQWYSWSHITCPSCHPDEREDD